ncbi:cytochrome P450 [Mycena maculata]|uniref:Cytochrome P450 n=1 Tax=Mycena maculata TaxID=230809 RepID=A0AAD7HKT8_9AGAR|nr:cytochrome P450 [Mycena maculata]
MSCLDTNHIPPQHISVAEQASKISGWALTPGRWLVDYWPIRASFLLPLDPHEDNISWVSSIHPFLVPLRTLQAAELGMAFHPQFPLGHPAQLGEILNSLEAAGTNIPSTSHLLRPGMTEEAEDIAPGHSTPAQQTLLQTVSATISFVMLMALHSAIQKRAQAEIDSITSGTPQFADVYRLPFLLAMLKEVMRYAPVANLALPHQVTQDDTYAGYRIPAGATMVLNVYAILHDAETYPDPFLFDPDRFFAGAGPASPDPGKIYIGWDVGIRFVEPVLLLSMASILYHFTISRNLKAHVGVEFTTGITYEVNLMGDLGS